jgi:hypothetical protein
MNKAILAASAAASLFAATLCAAATPPASDTARVASSYSSWAGSRGNAEALVTGLKNGTPIAITTVGPNRSVSIAGFTPAGTMSYGNVNNALASAQRSLARVGIKHPSAEQIQAGLLGGDVELPGGKVQSLRGTVAAKGGNPQLAAR